MNTARSIAGKGWSLIGVGADPEAPCCRSRVWDELVRTSGTVSDYLLALEELGTRLASNPATARPALLPTNDELVVAIAGEAARFARWFDFVLPDPDTVHRLMDKTAFHSWALANSFRVPLSRIVADEAQLERALGDLPGQVVVKPLMRAAAWDRRFPNDKAFIADAQRRGLPPPADLLAVCERLIVQQWIDGTDADVYFCLLYVGRDGDIQGEYAGRKLWQWPQGTGSTAVCCGIEEPALVELSRRVLTSAGVRGLCSLEVKRSRDDGEYYITEPTVGRNDFQSYVATAGGINLTEMAVRDAWGLPRIPTARPRRAVWADEWGIIRNARRGRSVLTLLRQIGAARVRRAGFALWTPLDFMPLLRRLRDQIGRRHQERPDGAGRAAALRLTSPAPLTVERWDEPQFLQAEQEWQELLARSDADPLFLSWRWQTSWWLTYSKANRLELVVIAVRDGSGRLIGLAPLFRHHVRRLGRRVERLEFIGNIWQGMPTMRTEFLDVIAARDAGSASRAALLAAIEQERWSELVWRDLPLCSPSLELLRLGAIRGVLIRVLQRDVAYSVEAHQSFDSYVRELSSAARRRLFGQRARLLERGEVRLRQFDGAEFCSFAPVLDRLHAVRWGPPFFIGRMRTFHESLVGNGAARLEADLSVLEVAGVARSALYNVVCGNRLYNLQAGFDETWSQGISLGKLHMGYLIERAFGSARSVDFLLGAGKRENYKAQFANHARAVVSVHLVRDAHLKLAFRARDVARRRTDLGSGFDPAEGGTPGMTE